MSSSITLTTHFPIQTATQAIRATKPPITPRQRDAFDHLIDKEGAIVEADITSQYAGEIAKSADERQSAADRLTEARARRRNYEARVVDLESSPGSLTKTFFYMRGFLLLKGPIHRFQTWAPDRAVHIFHVFLAAAVVCVGISLALVRNEATRLLDALARNLPNVEVNTFIINAFFFAVSTVLILAGAVFFCAAFEHGGPVAALVKSRWRLWRSRRQERAIEHEGLECTKRAAELAAAAKVKPQLLADAWMAQARLELAGLPIALPTADEAVTAQLGLDPELPNGTHLAASSSQSWRTQ